MIREPEIVASGSVNVIGEVGGGMDGVVISERDIADKVTRRCDNGFVGCGFHSVQLCEGAMVGQVLVKVLCSKQAICVNNNRTLEVDLNRLRSAAPDPVREKRCKLN